MQALTALLHKCCAYCTKQHFSVKRPNFVEVFKVTEKTLCQTLMEEGEERSVKKLCVCLMSKGTQLEM